MAKADQLEAAVAGGIPRAGSIGDLKRRASELQRIREQYLSDTSRVASDLQDLGRLQGQVLAIFRGTDNEIRSLISGRDTLLRQQRAEQSEAASRGVADTREGRKIKGQLAQLQKKAGRVFGRSVSLPEMEALVISSRPVSRRESDALRDLAGEASKLSARLSENLKLNGKTLASATVILRALEGLESGGLRKIPGGKGDRAQASLKDAIKSTRAFQSEVANQRRRLTAAEGAVSKLESAAAKQGQSAVEAARTLNRGANVFLLAGGIAAYAGAATNPVTGIVVALGLLGKLVAEVLNLIRKIRRR